MKRPPNNRQTMTFSSKDLNNKLLRNLILLIVVVVGGLALKKEEKVISLSIAIKKTEKETRICEEVQLYTARSLSHDEFYLKKKRKSEEQTLKKHFRLLYLIDIIIFIFNQTTADYWTNNYTWLSLWQCQVTFSDVTIKCGGDGLSVEHLQTAWWVLGCF